MPVEASWVVLLLCRRFSRWIGLFSVRRGTLIVQRHYALIGNGFGLVDTRCGRLTGLCENRKVGCYQNTRAKSNMPATAASHLLLQQAVDMIERDCPNEPSKELELGFGILPEARRHTFDIARLSCDIP